MGNSTERSAEEAIAAIERLTRELLSRREGAHLIEHELDRLAAAFSRLQRSLERQQQRSAEIPPAAD